MNRKEQILDVALTKTPDAALHFIRGALWADENPQNGSRDLLREVQGFLQEFGKGNTTKHELYVLQTKLYEYLK